MFGKGKELVLCYLLLGLVGPGIWPTGPALPFSPAPYPESPTIRFANGIELDTRQTPGAAPESVLAAGTYWLVNLSEPVRQDHLSALRRLGVEPLCYLAYQTIACRLTRQLPGRYILELPGARWLGPLRPEYKLAPELCATRPQPAAADEDLEVVVCLWPGELVETVVRAVQSAGGLLVSVSPRGLRCLARPALIPELCRLDQVAWVQLADPPTAFNSEAQWVTQTGWRGTIPDPVAGRRVWANGIRGENMTVGLIDAGINTDHDQFRDPTLPLFAPGVFPRHRKLAGYKLYRNATFGDISSFHGSGVAGTLAGDDSVTGDLSKADGMAPKARIFFVDVATALAVYVFGDDISDLLDSVRLAPGLGEPVLQVSGSFGSDVRPGYYRLLESSLDAVAWNDRRFLVVWAAGNAGTGPYRVGHPSCAKSALTVGACGNGTASNLMADFSSRGPTRDGRIKPDIVAPGQGITTVDGPGLSQYSLHNGTSYSAPCASGALLLARQYLREGWFPSGRPEPGDSIPLPSSALLRALAVAGADHNVGSEPLPNFSAGWGRLNLGNMLHFAGDSLRLTFVDDTVGLSTGQYHEYQVQLVDRKPLRVALVWTDTAAIPEALIALVNDLDLELVSPDRNGYRGNQFLDGESRSNPDEWDSRNVVEVCQLNLPLTGTWTIRVRARNVYTERQPYALVVRASLAGIPGVGESAPRPWPTPGQGGTVISSGSRPLQLTLRAGTRFTVLSSSGQVQGTFRADRSQVITWRGTDSNNQPLPAGVYFCCLDRPDGRDVRRIVLVR